MRDGVLERCEGPVFDIAERVLVRQSAYSKFRAGELTQRTWSRVIDSTGRSLAAGGFPAADVPFLKRIPADQARLVDGILEDLQRRGVVPTQGPAPVMPDLERYEHSGRMTFIYPEEGLLLARLTAAVRPRCAIFLGSYYGYWAHFALPEIVATEGSAVLVDPDPEVAGIAWLNYRNTAGVTIACTTGEAYLDRSSERFDLVVLDAELPRDHPDPELRGKGLYHRLLGAVLPRLKPDAVLIAHNILFRDETGDPFFDGVIRRNEAELGPFMALARDAFGFVEYPTTEGVGIGRLGSNRIAE